MASMTKVYCCILLLLAFMMVSCEEETSFTHPDYELVIPEAAYSFSISTKSVDTNTTVTVEPTFTPNFDLLGCYVKKIVYALDGKEVATVTEKPYKLEYQANNLAKGNHVMKMTFTVGGKGFKDKVIEKIQEFDAETGTSETSQTLKDVTFDFDYDSFLRVGEDFKFSITMNDLKNLGYKIESVQFYWENELVKTVVDAPYEYTFKPEIVVGMIYSVRAEIKYALGNNTYHHSWSGKVNCISEEETIRSVKTNYENGGHYENGDELVFKAKVYRGTGDEKQYTFNLYWDDVLLTSSKTFPYVYTYKISNASVGIHTIYMEWVITKEDGTPGGSVRTIDMIVIDK